ncbi:hypothetical protein [Nonomuraea turcica]|uniref:hypothetical protein n=1 Tax=Nonomuraea sp. G32 TaxID=3067274 RepID=UPI00273B0762|nr:hypothetical protein [Nonomuraea sp. G32]MDP4506163.1 hypothetical protein [Nonomuraea sp. G32]
MLTDLGRVERWPEDTRLRVDQLDEERMATFLTRAAPSRPATDPGTAGVVSLLTYLRKAGVIVAEQPSATPLETLLDGPRRRHPRPTRRRPGRRSSHLPRTVRQWRHPHPARPARPRLDQQTQARDRQRGRRKESDTELAQLNCLDQIRFRNVSLTGEGLGTLQDQGTLRALQR